MADNDTLRLGRRRRGSNQVSLALPVDNDEEDEMAASFVMGNSGVEFHRADVRIDKDGLYINGAATGPIQEEGVGNAASIHQNDLYPICELGRGACGIVRKVRHETTGTMYAVKVFNIFDKEKREQLLQEIVTLAQIECPTLIDFHGAYLRDGSIHVILEYMDLGGLDRIIHEWRSIQYDELVIGAVAYQMLWALGYLHFERRLHRDIKPQNVLLNSAGEVKLGDFGIARELSDEADLAQTMVGTIRYMSPERLAGDGYGAPGDIWSLGILLLEMATRKLPFMQAPTQIDLHDMLERMNVEDLIATCGGDLSDSFRDMLRGCLCFDPNERMSADELLHCEWFEDMNILELDHATQVMHEWLQDNGQFGDHGTIGEEVAASGLAPQRGKPPGLGGLHPMADVLASPLLSTLASDFDSDDNDNREDGSEGDDEQQTSNSLPFGR